MSVCFGLYIGNSTCSLSVSKAGKVDVVANASGDRVTPALVAYHESEVVAGVSAKQGLLRNASCTVGNVIRTLSSQEQNIEPIKSLVPIIYKEGKPYFIVKRDDKVHHISPADALLEILKLLKDIAGSHTSDEKDLPLIMAVPSWAGGSTSAVLRTQATAAGFKVLALVSQPAAACLAYNLLDDNSSSLTVLTLHCGGSSVVASLGTVSGGLLSIKENVVSFSISGNSITESLVQHFAKEFYMKYKGDPLENKRSRMKLFTASETCKHVLSTMSTGQVHVESLWEGVDFSTQLSRARFEGLVASTLTDILQPARDLLSKCQIGPHDIQKVALSGGTCKIPKLQMMLSALFPEAEILKSILPDETLALGAAVDTSYHKTLGVGPPHPPTSLISTLSKGLFCKMKEGEESFWIMTQGTPIHSKRLISIPIVGLTAYSWVLYEGDSPSSAPHDNQVLVQVDLPSLDEKPTEIQIKCHLKSDATLHFELKESKSQFIRSFVLGSEKT